MSNTVNQIENDQESLNTEINLSIQTPNKSNIDMYILYKSSKNKLNLIVNKKGFVLEINENNNNIDSNSELEEENVEEVYGDNENIIEEVEEVYGDNDDIIEEEVYGDNEDIIEEDIGETSQISHTMLHDIQLPSFADISQQINEITATSLNGAQQAVDMINNIENIEDVNFPQYSIYDGLDADEFVRSTMLLSLIEVEDLFNTNNIQQNNNCVICRDNLLITSRPYICSIKKCKHLFHSECIRPWFNRHHTCPICRIDVRINRTNNNY